jgi:Domain of unknown function DUF29
MMGHMPDGLYERDILAWSEHQADLLRRLERGERVNDVDWTNVAEEIEGVGLSELHAVESFLRLIITHVLKLYAWPDSEAFNHWRGEIVVFQAEALGRFSPSMRQRVNVDGLYATALKQLQTIDRTLRLPPDNPFSQDDLINEDGDVLLTRLPPKA